MTEGKSILIISTLDTKGVETSYLREKIKELGGKPIVLDVSMRGKAQGEVEIPAQEVAEAGGSSLKAIQESTDRAASTVTMTAGAFLMA